MITKPQTAADYLSKRLRWEKEVSSDSCSLLAVVALKTNPTRQKMLKQQSWSQHVADIQVSMCPLDFFLTLPRSHYVFFLPLALPAAGWGLFAGGESACVWTSSFCCRIPVRTNSAVTMGTDADRAGAHKCQSSSHEITTVRA